MIRVTIDVNVPAFMARGVGEDTAMYLERFGDARVISITELTDGRRLPQTHREQIQMEMDEWRQLNATYGVRP